ncbi:MAG: DUF3413 domain-containing protein, partial [Gammaproteobacteria bacterium]|nr:DUF3413 domain-containing protein [Gammaproteobacteria bacterium]
MTQIQHALRNYYAVVFLLLCLLIAQYWQYIEATEPLVHIYTALSALCYALIYLLPVILLGQLFHAVLRPGAEGAPPWRSATVYAAAWVSGLIVLALVFADLQLFRLYEYHINAFVWNLITTPGGLAALGATEETSYTIAGLVVLGALALSVILFVLHRLAAKPRRPHLSRRRVLSLAGLLFAAFLATEGVHAFSSYTGKESYLQA